MSRSTALLAALALGCSLPPWDGASDTAHPASTGAHETTTSFTTGALPIDCDVLCDTPWVYAGDLDITPATEPASLHCMSRVTGTVWIRGFTGPLPTALRGLRTVSEALVILGNDGLASLDGLECVRTAAGLEIAENPALSDISALRLTSAGIVALRLNPRLEDASALASAADVAALSFLGNERLRILPELAPGVRLRHLGVEFCPALEDLDALSAARGLPAAVPPVTVTLRANDSLRSISGLAGLWTEGTVPEFVTLEGLPALRSLAGLEGLREVRYLVLSDLGDLESLAGLGGLEVASHVRLDRLPNLSSLDGLGALRETELLRIGECGDGDRGLDALVDLSGLDALETLSTLALAGNDALSALAGLSALNAGPFELFAADNPSLPASEIDAFAAQHGTLSVCATPPEASCPCP